MKKSKVIILALIAVLAFCFLFVACSDPDGSDDIVIITANDAGFVYENKTLLDYMNYLQSKEELSFTIDDGMVTSINGKTNTTNSYWMLYTSDSENANENWGTYDNNGDVYGSAMVGAGTLAIKKNCVYVWVYQTF